MEDKAATLDRKGLETSLPAEMRLLPGIFGMEFNIVDAETGEVLHAAPDQPARDWGVWGELCREVARRGRPRFIAEEGPLATLAVPMAGKDRISQVAVATFVTRPGCPDEAAAAATRLLGMDPARAAEWAARQTPWAPEALERVAGLATDHYVARRQLEELQREAESLSVHLSSTFEEISLLHRIAQNLKISESNEDLAKLALQWMQVVLSAEGVAAQFVPLNGADKSPGPPAEAEPTLLSFGRCPIDNGQFTRLVEHVGLAAGNRPVVINPPRTAEPAWPWPEVRQVIVVPMAEGSNLFGWLAAFNHVHGAEFGTVEASLLNSVSAILGIHSGNIELYRQQSELLTGIVRALTSAIDAKDPYTCGHSDRVARVAVRLAQELGCDARTLNTIYLSGLLHDIGKIGINDNVLRKPDRLTAAEYEHIKTHVQIGHRILIDLKKLDDVLPVVLHHHESWDGGGYPRRLPADQIPLSARIVAVADAFDAMGSDRPYRKGMPDERIDEIFRQGAGKQWDPEVVAAFFRAREDIREVVRRGPESAAIGPALWS